jgi:Helix-turn-helix domain
MSAVGQNMAEKARLEAAPKAKFEKVIGSREAANRLGISTVTAVAWAQTGRVAAFQDRWGFWYFDVHSVDELAETLREARRLEERMRPPSAELSYDGARKLFEKHGVHSADFRKLVEERILTGVFRSGRPEPIFFRAQVEVLLNNLPGLQKQIRKFYEGRDFTRS